MIIKKKINNLKLIVWFKKFINQIIYILGSFTLITIFILSLYYFNSGMYDRYKPIAALKKIDQVLFYKYLGFSFFEIDDYLINSLKSFKFILFNNELENTRIDIDQKNLYNLELQRTNKINSISEKVKKFSFAELNHDQNEYNIKLRVKGDRVLHWYDRNQTSYRIDIRGENRVWGLEEFSIQKPITRNYVYEYIFHKFLEFNGLISLKYFFVNLSLNDTNQGIYAVEEGFSKELIERNKKRNGPIFGLEEADSINYPDVKYDLYSRAYWQSNYSELVNYALFKLENLKNSDLDLRQNFDLEKWATFFAVIDITGTFHGSIPKSVKLYYNPATAKFEPIGFDGHYNNTLFQDFILIDFLDLKNKNCSYICSDRQWYLKFFNNPEFVNLYLKKLEKLSSKNQINKFINLQKEKIKFYNNQFLSEISYKDRGLYKGLGLYIYDDNYLTDRSLYIQKRINELKNKKLNLNKDTLKEINYRKNILLADEILKQGENYILNENLIIDEDLYLGRYKKLKVEKGVKITFEKDSSLFSEGAIEFMGTKNEPIIIDGNDKKGSLILVNNFFKFKNVNINNLSYPKDKSKILYGGINIINSNVDILNMKINSSNSEDAINIISSESVINNLELANIYSDAIDIDFGTLVFKNITCKKIKNDCLDISGATVEGDKLKGYEVNDKGLSFGEKSIGKITNIDFDNTKLGIAVKDGSKLDLSNLELKNNQFHVAVFNKKKEYDGASLTLNNFKNNEKLNYLLGIDNEIFFEKKYLNNKIKNKEINKIFY